MKTLLTGLLLALSISANGAHYYDPAHPGHGVSMTQDNGQGSAFIWYNYNLGGEPRWLISTDNCHSFPCVAPLAEASGTWMGGELELVEVGVATIMFDGGVMVFDYDVRDWAEAGECGRLIQAIMNKCVGTFHMERIDGLD